MSSSRKLLSALALVLLVLAVDSAPFSSSSSRGNVSPSDSDLRGSDLARVLASPVYLTEKMWRPKGSSSGSDFDFGSISFPRNWDPTKHSGVRVTLGDRSKWLIHKGSGYGRSSQTVVTDAQHMSSAWQVEETRDFHGTRTVSDLIRVGGANYDLGFGNCHFAAEKIMELP